MGFFGITPLGIFGGKKDGGDGNTSNVTNNTTNNTTNHQYYTPPNQGTYSHVKPNIAGTHSLQQVESAQENIAMAALNYLRQLRTGDTDSTKHDGTTPQPAAQPAANQAANNQNGETPSYIQHLTGNSIERLMMTSINEVNSIRRSLYAENQRVEIADYTKKLTAYYNAPKNANTPFPTPPRMDLLLPSYAERRESQGGQMNSYSLAGSSSTSA